MPSRGKTCQVNTQEEQQILHSYSQHYSLQKPKSGKDHSPQKFQCYLPQNLNFAICRVKKLW